MSSSAHHSASPPLQNQASISQEASGKTPIQGSYQYQPLPSHEHFRILELLPDDAAEKGGSGGVVCCRLHTEPFADAKDTYAALSYVWGDANDRVPIVCDGKIVKVTVNLADALRHIQDHTEFRFVWADAICIDQEDDVEKGHQVRRMGMIYEHAVEVVVWLGKDDEGIAEDCFNLIRETNEYLDHQLEIYGLVSKITTITRAIPFSFEKVRWNKVQKLVNLPWFNRLWVLQEAALAKQCQLLWGQHRLNLAELHELYLFINYSPGLSNLVGSNAGREPDTFVTQCTYGTIKTWMDTKPLIKSELKRAQETGHTNFLDLLDSGRSLAATFEIDRVYAFLGNPLARKYEEQTLLIEPDYNKSMQDVYFEVACELLAHPREAPYVLSRVDHHHSDCVEGMTLRKNGAFPSWVPRWDKQWRQKLMSYPNLWFRAGGIEKKFAAIFQNDKSLLLSAIIFDQVVWTSDIIKENYLALNPDDWDKGAKTSKEPFIDILFTQVQQALYQHRTSLSSEFLASSMPIEDVFSLTMLGHYPHRNTLKFDFIKHKREYLAYHQAARQSAHTLMKKGLSRAVQNLPPSLGGPAKTSQLPDSTPDIGDTSPLIYENELYYAHARRFAITKSGRFGLVPWLAQPKDVCCIFPGMQVPLILRPRKDGRYGLVGDSYIHGVMGGEVMEQLEKGEMKLENIVLV